IDPGKNFLWQSDVSSLEPKIRAFLKQEGRFECAVVEGVKDLLVKRTKEQLEYARTVLNSDSFQLDESVEIQLDPEKRTWIQDADDARKRQFAHIQFQVSNYLLTDLKLPEARKQLIHRYELNLKRVEELSKSDMYSYVVNAFASALDPHSDYLSPEDTEDFRIDMSLSLEGIGASLSSDDGFTVIQELIPGGAAARSKLLEPKDKIIAVGQGEAGALENVIDMNLRDVVRKIRGKAGSKVRIRILREKPESQRFDVTLVRSKVKLEDKAANVEYSTRTVGGKRLTLARLELPAFYGDPTRRERSSYRDVANAIQEIKKRKADGIVLDLSQNGGGLLEEAVRIVGLFINKGNVVATKDARKEVQALDDDDPLVQWEGPLVVLTSRLSASASEIVAGALQDYKRAVLVGSDHTYGKGSVQAVLPLQNDLGILKVTTGLFYIPGGRSTQHRGVASDVVIPSIFAAEDVGEKYLDHSLNPDAIPAFLSPEANSTGSWAPVTETEVERLRQQSKVRVTASKEFQEIEKELKELNERRGPMKLSELRKKDQEQKAKDKKKGKKEKPPKELAKERHAPHRTEAFQVLADLIQLRTSTPLAGAPRPR
ncbi:MAG: carboxy terminal-processing peptidase, partial [Bdellovibrionales bacterium]|nr:carboxy terminal-processing peptidase [Bdellovibrionales bacterium]